MKKGSMTSAQRQTLKKRGLVETVIDQLKIFAKSSIRVIAAPLMLWQTFFQGLLLICKNFAKPQ